MSHYNSIVPRHVASERGRTSELKLASEPELNLNLGPRVSESLSHWLLGPFFVPNFLIGVVIARPIKSRVNRGSSVVGQVKRVKNQKLAPIILLNALNCPEYGDEALIFRYAVVGKFEEMRVKTIIFPLINESRFVFIAYFCCQTVKIAHNYLN